MKWLVSLVLLLLSFATGAEEFLIGTQGKNLSLLKVALPRTDLLAEGESLNFSVSLTDSETFESIAGAFTFSLTHEEPSTFITGAKLLEHFAVTEGMLVNLGVGLNDSYRMDEGSRLLCGRTGCREIFSWLRYDQVDGSIENLRIMPVGRATRCANNPGKLAFVNKSSNLQHRSVLQIRNSADNHQLLRISREPTFSNAADIALLRIEARETLRFAASDLEDATHAKVIQAMKASVGNQQLYVDSAAEASDLDCRTWVISDGTFHPIREVFPDPEGLVPFFPATDDPENQPILNFLELHNHFEVNQFEEIVVEAYRFNGEKVMGLAQILPQASAIASGKLLVTLSDLRFGNAKKGITSSFGQALSGLTQLKIRYLGSCDRYNYSCSPRVQALMMDSTGAVRDFSWSLGLNEQRGPHILGFFNRAENQSQASYLLLHNTEPYAVNVAIIDSHHPVEDALAVVSLPPGMTRLISSVDLEYGSSAVVHSLMNSDMNRQLKIVPLSNGSLRLMNLVLDSDGRWHNLSLPDMHAPLELR